MDKTKKMNQLAEWKSEFGKQYTERNKYDPENRKEAFKEMIKELNVRKILEMGCNIGNNLVTLSKINEDLELVGIEPNKHAVEVGRSRSNKVCIMEGNGFDLPFKDGWFDLTFTAGVLIHISSDNLPKAIDELFRTSNKYILIIEYFSEKETEITYRGRENLLFKRNFKEEFLKRKPLKCMKEGFWDNKAGFDNCNWWLFEKKGN